jgi:large conductance mechanosensitive channel protein
MKNNLKYQKLELENKILKEEFDQFKKFAFKGDMIKISIGIILGNSFNAVVQSISNNIIMPIVNFLISKTGSNWRNLEFEIAEGIKIEIGKFLGSTVDFLLVAIFLYIIYIKIFGKFFIDDDKNFQKTLRP